MNQQLDNYVYTKPGLLVFLQQWWSSQGFATKLILGFSLTMGLLNIVTQWPFQLFYNAITPTVPFQIQRLFFAQFVHYYILDLLIAVYCVAKYFKEYEHRLGTVVFLIGILLISFVIQVLCLLLSFGLSYLYDPLYSTPAYGLWNFVTFFIIQETLMQPNGQSQFLFLPMQMTNKYYPFAFISLFTMIQQSITFVSAGLVSVCIFLFQDRLLAFQNPTIEKIEKSFVFCRFFERPDFKRVTNYQDQLEPSVDHREQQVGTPPAKLTIEGSAPFPPSMVLQDLQKQLETKEAEQEQPIQEEEEEEKEVENTTKHSH